MMTRTLEETQQSAIKTWLRLNSIYNNESFVVRQVIDEMAKICDADDADEDEQTAALYTLMETFFPGRPRPPKTILLSEFNSFGDHKNELNRIKSALTDVVKNPERWLEKPNLAFDNKSPLELISNGEHEKIWQAIYILQSGTPS